MEIDDLTPMLRDARFAGWLSFPFEDAGIDGIEESQASKKEGLACPGGSENRDAVAGIHFHRDVVEQPAIGCWCPAGDLAGAEEERLVTHGRHAKMRHAKCRESAPLGQLPLINEWHLVLTAGLV